MWADPTTWGYVFVAAEWVIRLVMLVVVPFRRSPAVAKGWLLLIFFEPSLGLLLYLVLGRSGYRAGGTSDLRGYRRRWST